MKVLLVEFEALPFNDSDEPVDGGSGKFLDRHIEGCHAAINLKVRVDENRLADFGARNVGKTDKAEVFRQTPPGFDKPLLNKRRRTGDDDSRRCGAIGANMIADAPNGAFSIKVCPCAVADNEFFTAIEPELPSLSQERINPLPKRRPFTGPAKNGDPAMPRRLQMGQGSIHGSVVIQIDTIDTLTVGRIAHRDDRNPSVDNAANEFVVCPHVCQRELARNRSRVIRAGDEHAIDLLLQHRHRYPAQFGTGDDRCITGLLNLSLNGDHQSVKEVAN